MAYVPARGHVIMTTEFKAGLKLLQIKRKPLIPIYKFKGFKKQTGAKGQQEKSELFVYLVSEERNDWKFFTSTAVEYSFMLCEDVSL